MIALVLIKNPFDIHNRDIKNVEYSAVKTLTGYVLDTKITDAVKVAVNGRLIDESEWSTTIPADGDNIVICPVVGKGGGKNVLGMVAAIALSVVSMGIGSAVTGGAMFGAGSVAMTSWTFAGYMAAAAVMYMGGTLLQNMSGSVAVDSGNYATSQTYSWDGAQTHASQGSPIPLTYGKVKITNNNVLSAHVTSDGEKQYLNLLLTSGEGEVDSISDITIANNSISNYNDVLYETRLGTNEQPPIDIPTFSDSFADQSLSYELTTDDWKTQQVDGNATQGLEVTIEFPSGMYYANDQGGLSTTGVNFTSQYKLATDTDWKSFKDDYISAASSSAVRRVYRLDNLPAGSYMVRCMLSKKDGTGSRYANKCNWTQVSSIIPDRFSYPGMVLVALKALATSQLSGSSPAITWIQERKNVWVWNPYTAVYEQRAATNPAWICYDILHLCRKIKDTRSGQYVYDVSGCPVNIIMYDDFKAWADECDRRGLVCNYFLDASGDLDAAFKSLEAAGRGKVVRRGTKYGCIYDHVATPVQMFSVGNINMSTFSLDYLAVEDRANAVEITFNNERKNYQRDTMIVYGDDYDASDTSKTPTQITLDAITNPDAIYREGKYYLRRNKHLVRTVTFNADVDAISSQVGDVVLVQHDVPQWGFGGRIVSATTRTVQLDRAVSVVAGTQYEITVRLQNDTIVKRTITPSNTGDIDMLTVDVAFDAVPAQYDVYSFGKSGISTKPFTVISMSRTSDSQMTLECLEYNEAVYSEATNVPVIDYSQLDVLVNVSSVSLGQETYRQKDGTVVSNIYASWTIDRGKMAKSFDVYISNNGAAWWHYANTSLQNIVINGVKAPAEYQVKIIANNEAGTPGAEKISSISVTGKDAAPANISGLTAVVNPADRTQFTLNWTSATDIDLNHYQIASNGVSVNTTSNTITLTASTNNASASVVAVDNSGNVSANAATITAATVMNPSNVSGFSLNQRATDRSIVDMSWAAVTDTDLAHYELRVGDTWDAGQVVNKPKSLSASYQLTASGNYRLWIAAVNAAGRYSINKGVKEIQVECQPDQPTNITYSQDVRNAKRVILSWTPAAGQDIAGYEISRDGVVVGFAADAMYTDTVSASGTYDYSIRTKTVGAFYSGYAHLTATVMLEPLDVTNFKATQQLTDKSIVRLTWDANPAGDLSHYEIREGSSWDTGTVVVSHAVGTYADVPISEERSYTWQIKAVSSNAYSSLYPAIVSDMFSLNPTKVSAIQAAQSNTDCSILNIQWTGVDDRDLAGYQVKIGDIWESAEALPLTQELYTQYKLKTSGSYRIMIKTLNNSGFYSDETSIQYSAKIEPSDVGGFLAFQNGDNIELYWNKIPDVDVVGYEVREGYSFDQSALISTGITDTKLTIPIDTERLYKYYIKAVNHSGKYSVSAGAVSINVTEIAPRNVIDTFDEIALADGSMTNVEFGQSSLNFQTIGGRFSDYPTLKFSEVGGISVLKLKKKADGTYYTSGEYTTTVIDIGSVITCNVTTLFTNSTMLSGGSVTLQVKSSQNGNVWTAWEPFKPIQRTFRYLQFRVDLSTSNSAHTPEVNQFKVSIDVPDTDLAQSGHVSSGSSTFTYGHTFYTVPYVTPCAIGDGLRAEVVSKDKSSCVLRVRNLSGADVGGKVDVRIKGY